jgi:hypothetical protein
MRNALSCAARQGSESQQPIRITATNAEDLAVDNQERLLRAVAKRAIRRSMAARGMRSDALAFASGVLVA